MFRAAREAPRSGGWGRWARRLSKRRRLQPADLLVGVQEDAARGPEVGEGFPEGLGGRGLPPAFDAW